MCLATDSLESYFEELKRKSEDANNIETTKCICSARGAYVIQGEQWERGVAKVYEKITENYIENVTFEESCYVCSTRGRGNKRCN